MANSQIVDQVSLLQAILTQLQISNRLSAVRLKAETSQQDLIKVLSTTGATNQEIADVLDTTADTVRSAINKMRKRAIQASPGRGTADGAE